MGTFDIPPREERIFTKDEVSSTFRKVCSLKVKQGQEELIYLDKWSDTEVMSLAQPIRLQHDHIREVLCLQKLKNVFGDNVGELFPVLREYGLCEGSNFALTMSLAKLRSLKEYCELNEENDGQLLLESVPGDRLQKLSVLVRIVFAVYSLNFIADIGHNDLGVTNILMDTTEHAFVRFRFHDANNVIQSIVVPTYGVKPIICDFGMSTQFSTTYHPMDDFDLIKYNASGIIPPLNRTERVKAAEVIDLLYHLHQMLLTDDPLCTATASALNTYTVDVTNKAQSSCNVCRMM